VPPNSKQETTIMTKNLITGPAAALINMKRLSAVAACVVLTAAVSLATPSLAAKTVITESGKIVLKGNGTVKTTSKGKIKSSSGSTSTKTTTKTK
jgi:hypothetical protein